MIAEIVAEETGRDIEPVGSTTSRRNDLKKGFEPDSCFYIEDAARMRDKDDLDLTVDPPPELVIEVDITRSSLPRMPIFAAIGVREVWRYDGERVAFHRLEGADYREVVTSVALPPLSAAQATVFLGARKSEARNAWLRRVREWVRSAR